MDTDEPGRERPTIDDATVGKDAGESPALGPFVLALGECAGALARLRERVDEHLGVPPDEVAWGHVADADRLLYHLRQAAFVAGLGGEPLP